jgi:acyl CoA:acetate/3-ketoacid CoA transferase
MARGFARLDRAGNLNRAREQQQLFGQGGFARVGVEDDGKGPAAAHFI